MKVAKKIVVALVVCFCSVLLVQAARHKGGLTVWAINEGIRIDPVTGEAIEGDSEKTPGGISGDYQNKNLIWDSSKEIISIKGAANEVLGFQLILDGAGVSNINITCSDLRGRNGAVIPAANVTLYRAFYINVNQRYHYKWGNFPLGKRWYPDPLVPLSTAKIGAPFAIDGSNFKTYTKNSRESGVKNQTVWTDVWIPKKARAGKYNGKLTITSSAGEISVKISVEVFGFELPDESHMTCEMLSYSEFSRKSSKEWRNNFYVIGQQHRITLTTSEAHRNHKPKLLPKSYGVLDWTGFDKNYGPAINGTLYKDGPRAGAPAEYFILAFGPRLSRPDKGNGMRGKSWPIPCPTKNNETEVDFTPEYVKEFSALLENASDHFAKKYPNTKILVFQDALDESPFHKDNKELAFSHLRSIQSYGKIFKKANKKHNNIVYRLDIGSGFAECRYDLDGDGKLEKSGDVVDSLGDIIGLWAINGSRLSLDAMKPVMKRGIPVWFYNGYEPRVGPTLIGTEALGPRTWPWIVWNSRLQGTCMWSFLHRYKDSAWVTGGSKSKNPGEALFFYRGKGVGLKGQMFMSMRLKAFRRGMQDYEYLYLLSKKDRKTNRADKYAVSVVKNNINVKLNMEGIKDDEVNEVSTGKLSDGDKRHWSHNPEDFEKVRYRIGKLLSK